MFHEQLVYDVFIILYYLHVCTFCNSILNILYRRTFEK